MMLAPVGVSTGDKRPVFHTPTGFMAAISYSEQYGRPFCKATRCFLACLMLGDIANPRLWRVSSFVWTRHFGASPRAPDS